MPKSTVSLSLVRAFSSLVLLLLLTYLRASATPADGCCFLCLLLSRALPEQEAGNRECKMKSEKYVECTGVHQNTASAPGCCLPPSLFPARSCTTFITDLLSECRLGADQMQWWHSKSYENGQAAFRLNQ